MKNKNLKFEFRLKKRLSTKKQNNFKKYLTQLHSDYKPKIKVSFEQPLISVQIHNYNYAMYLNQCLQSVFSQSYKNFEVCFSDNASTDGSWEIARKFQKKFSKKMSIVRHPSNMGPQVNVETNYYIESARLRIQLCSDDFLRSDCLLKVATVFRNFPQIGFVLYHRFILDDKGNVKNEPPFYKYSAIIPGIRQASVYMLAAVNPSISQICYDVLKMPKEKIISPLTRWWGSRMSDFKICLNHPIAYLTDPLLGHRVHSQSDSSKTTKSNLLEIIGPYLLNHYFLDASNNHPKIKQKLKFSINKLANLSLRYSALALLKNKKAMAESHYFLALSLGKNYLVRNHGETIKRLLSKKTSRADVRKNLIQIKGLAYRYKSYGLPKGSKRLKI